jgi:hypothetical protein
LFRESRSDRVSTMGQLECGMRPITEDAPGGRAPVAARGERSIDSALAPWERRPFALLSLLEMLTYSAGVG